MQSDDMISLQVVGSSTLQEIRVILSNRQGQYIQEDVSLSGNQDYDMMYEGTATTLTSGEVWKANQFEWKKGEKVIRFIPRNRQSKIKISSLEKGEELVNFEELLQAGGGRFRFLGEVHFVLYRGKFAPQPFVGQGTEIG